MSDRDLRELGRAWTDPHDRESELRYAAACVRARQGDAYLAHPVATERAKLAPRVGDGWAFRATTWATDRPAGRDTFGPTGPASFSPILDGLDQRRSGEVLGVVWLLARTTTARLPTFAETRGSTDARASGGYHVAWTWSLDLLRWEPDVGRWTPARARVPGNVRQVAVAKPDVSPFASEEWQRALSGAKLVSACAPEPDLTCLVGGPADVFYRLEHALPPASWPLNEPDRWRWKWPEKGPHWSWGALEAAEGAGPIAAGTLVRQRPDGTIEAA